MKTSNLKSMPNAKCKVLFELSENSKLERIVLRSYLTDVTVIDLSPEMPVLYNTYEWKLFCNFRKLDKKPPQTSIRHISKFTKEFLGINLYHQLKKEDIIILTDYDVLKCIEKYREYMKENGD